MTSSSSRGVAFDAVSEQSRTVLTARQALGIVGFLAAAAAVLHVRLAFELPAPWSLPDELIYSELAKSIADGHLPAVRGETTLGYGVLYPLLIAPVWGLFSDPSQAYVAAKVINGAVLALAAFPAHFLARRFVSLGPSVVVAGFSVFVPSMLYAGSLLTEVVLYPVFLLALLGIVASLQRPTTANQLLAVGGIALACLAKPLCVVLIAAYACATLQLAVVDRLSGGSAGRRLRAHSTALGLFAAMAAVGLVVPAALGHGPAALGKYGVVLGHIDLSGTAVWFVRHLAALDLYVAVAPFGASLVLVWLGLRPGAERGVQELSALATWVFGGVLLAAAAYSSKPLAGGEGYAPTGARLHERNVFALVPLLLIGLALYFELGRPGARSVKVVCFGIAAALPLLLPIPDLIHNANLQALTVIPWGAASIRGLWPLTFLPLAALALVALVGRRSSPVFAWALVAAAFTVTTVAANASQVYSSVSLSTAGVGKDRGWIDEAVGRDAEVLALWASPGAAVDLGLAERTIWMNEFYNRSVGTVVEIDTPMPYALPHRDATLRDGTLEDPAGRPIRSRLVLAPCWIRVHGAAVAEDARTGARVYRTQGPIKASIEDTVPRCTRAG